MGFDPSPYISNYQQSRENDDEPWWFWGDQPRQALGYWVSYPFDAGGWPEDR